MPAIEEKDFLRLSLILNNNESTTRDKYICKLVECVLSYSNKKELTITEICSEIQNKFQLEFDVLEIKNAIKLKNKGRVFINDGLYSLSPKVMNQLSTQESTTDILKKFVRAFLKVDNCSDEETMICILQKYIYYCFNSNVQNFISILGNDSNSVDLKYENGFKPTNKEIDLINAFFDWPNSEKNEFLFAVISSSFEYCMITSNKSPNVGKSIFKGKVFFLDTNIIFRIAGLNRDDRRFVSENFVKKCKEVGIKLCYTSSVFTETYRVIESKINYIKSLINGQPPLNSNLISKITDGYGINDFYDIYYEWCKKPHNNYLDFISFRSYLIQKVNDVLREFDYVDSSVIDASKEAKSDLFDNLMSYKNEKRIYRRTTDESVRTDVNQVLFVKSLRPQNAKSLWNLNEYIVSADQLLVSWSEKTFDGVPLVVIPSLWLSIILKVSGRATNDDYQSFCMFMTLRHHQTDEEKIQFNPTELLAKLSEKTTDREIKELIISEIITNTGKYSFETQDEYDTSIKKAFDIILEQKNITHEEELLKAVEVEKHKAEVAYSDYEHKLEGKKSSEELIKDLSKRNAEKKTKFFSQNRHIPLVIEGISGLFILLLFVLLIFRINPFYDMLLSVVKSESINDKLWSLLLWVLNLVIVSPAAYIKRLWDYLGSEERKNNLCAKYFKQQLNLLNEEKTDN